MYSGEAEAQMITRVVISGSVFIVKLAGKETLQLAKFLSAAVNGELSTSGQIRLKTLLKSGQPLKVFSLKGDDNFAEFAKGAKEYGIVYSVVKRNDVEISNQLYDIMVKQNDAAKINRVIEKYGLMQLQESDGSAQATETDNKADISENNERIQENNEMPIEDVRTLLAKMMEGGNAESENFPVVSESEVLSDTYSESLENNIEPELEVRVPGTPAEDRPSVKAEINQLAELRPADNTTANQALLASMLLPEDAEEKDRLKYGMELIDNAVKASYQNILNQTGGDVTDAGFNG